MDRKYGLPGSQYVSPDFARQLARQNLNNGSTWGGLGHLAQQMMLGYLGYQDEEKKNKDVADQNAAYMAMAKGMTARPWVNPDTGAPTIPDNSQDPAAGGGFVPPRMLPTQDAGGFAGGAAALQGLQDNRYAGRLSADLLMKQAEMQQQEMMRQRALQDQITLKGAPGWAAPKDPVPGRDVPLPPDVFKQRAELAGIEAAAKVQPPGGYQRTQDGNGMMPIPGGPEDPKVVEERKKAEAKAKASVERESNFPKVKASLADFERKVGTITATIDKALDLAAPVNPTTGRREQNSWATGYGALLDGIPNTQAGALKNYLTTIQANLGFDTLQKMRESSPTGGALGAVSENENRLLQAVNGALDPRQGAQLIENLSKIRQLYPQVLAEKQSAIQSDYGDLMSAGTGIPAGVDPKVWEYMTPEEKALFK